MVDPVTTQNILDEKEVNNFGFHLDTPKHSPINILGHKHIYCEGEVHKMKLTMEDLDSRTT
jgi:hypothetical protein